MPIQHYINHYNFSPSSAGFDVCREFTRCCRLTDGKVKCQEMSGKACHTDGY